MANIYDRTVWKNSGLYGLKICKENIAMIFFRFIVYLKGLAIVNVLFFILLLCLEDVRLV